MNLPQEVHVGSMVYQIVSTQEDWDQAILDGLIDGKNPAWAQTRHTELLIRIRPGIAEGQMRDSLMHEVLHCIWHQGSNMRNIVDRLDDPEEYLVERQAPHLLTVLRNNPDLLAYLLGESYSRAAIAEWPDPV